MRFVVLAAVVGSGCYSAGTFTDVATAFVGQRMTVGCLDIAVALTTDATAPSPIISYSFGNGCFHETIVDFTALRVVGYDADHTAFPLAPHDPKHELRPVRLDALETGDERIAYDGLATPSLVCVELGGFDGEAPARPGADDQRVCLSMWVGAR